MIEMCTIDSHLFESSMASYKMAHILDKNMYVIKPSHNLTQRLIPFIDRLSLSQPTLFRTLSFKVKIT